MTNSSNKQLMFKLHAMIAVIKTALRKMEQQRMQPGANTKHLDAMSSQLKNTLAICKKGIEAIEKVSAFSKKKPGGHVEMSSWHEYTKFKGMKPISKEEIEATDLDDLIKRLQ